MVRIVFFFILVELIFLLIFSLHDAYTEFVFHDGLGVSINPSQQFSPSLCTKKKTFVINYIIPRTCGLLVIVALLSGAGTRSDCSAAVSPFPAKYRIKHNGDKIGPDGRRIPTMMVNGYKRSWRYNCSCSRRCRSIGVCALSPSTQQSWVIARMFTRLMTDGRR